MDALKAEIERKRKAKQELTGGRKWMRKGEIEQLEAQRYKDAQRAKAGEQPDAGPSSSSARRADAPAAAPDGGAQPAEEGLLPPNALPDLEVKKRLRALRHPITLFDEAVAARWLRYTKVEDELRLSQAATNSELRAGQLFNERQLDERRLNEAASAGADGGADAAAVAATLPRAAEGAAGAAGSAAGTDAAHPGAGADAAAAGAAAGGASARAAAAPEVLRELDAYFAARGGAGAGGGQAGKGAGVLRTLHALLTEWYDELSARTDEEKRSARGKQATATFQETTRNLRPLVSQLRTAAVPADLFQHIVKIFTHIDALEYVAATDAYILAAIGNDPWPIGVTMVGIHTRAAREKIQTTHTAHVMNDETQRKYLQAIKRVITYAQKRHPTLPSQMVLHWNYTAASKEPPRPPPQAEGGAGAPGGQSSGGEPRR